MTGIILDPDLQPGYCHCERSEAIAKILLLDRGFIKGISNPDLVLRTPTKETGFLLNIRCSNASFRKKPGFWAPIKLAELDQSI